MTRFPPSVRRPVTSTGRFYWTDPETRRRHRVRVFRGWDGIEVRWVQYCAGCAADRENVTPADPGPGCAECGYTGRARRCEWVPLNENAGAFQKWDDQRWARKRAREDKRHADHSNSLPAVPHPG
jgi:hypothetical protein